MQNLPPKSDLSTHIDSDIANWQKLGKIGVSDKLTVTEKTAPGYGKVNISTAGFFQGLTRTFGKSETTISDASNTHKWIGEFQRKTFNDVNTIGLKIDSNSSPQELIHFKQSLHQMKEAIKNSSAGLTNLSNTYSEKRHTQSGDSMKAALERRIEGNSGLVDTIDIQLQNIENKLNKMMEPLDIQTNITMTNDHSINYAKSAEIQLQEYSKGIKVDIKPTTLTDNAGKTAVMPQQFALDLPRSPHFSLNNELIFSSISSIPQSPVEAFKKIKSALGNSESATIALTTFATQGMFTDTLHRSNELAKKELGLDDVSMSKNESTRFEHNIEIKGDEVKLTLKNGYLLRDPSNGDELGYQIVKREFQFSLKELQTLDLSKENPIKTIIVKDTYSQIYHNPDTMTYVYNKF